MTGGGQVQLKPPSVSIAASFPAALAKRDPESNHVVEPSQQEASATRGVG